MRILSIMYNVAVGSRQHNQFDFGIPSAAATVGGILMETKLHTQKHTKEAKEKMRQAHLGRRVSPSTEFKKDQKNPYEEKRVANLARGERNNKWNPSPTYSGIHQWISRVMGKPKECWDCGFTSENGRQFHWANKSREYKRDVSDWERLCASCHFKKDDIIARAWRTRKGLS